MPLIVDSLKLTEEQNRKIKLTEKTKQEIREKYALGGVSYNSLAEEYGVSKTTIHFTIKPEKAKEYSANSTRKKKYDREKNNEYTRRSREYKKKLHINGELKKAEKEYVKKTYGI